MEEFIKVLAERLNIKDQSDLYIGKMKKEIEIQRNKPIHKYRVSLFYYGATTKYHIACG